MYGKWAEEVLTLFLEEDIQMLSNQIRFYLYGSLGVILFGVITYFLYMYNAGRSAIDEVKELNNKIELNVENQKLENDLNDIVIDALEDLSDVREAHSEEDTSIGEHSISL